jgi:hypothetical protein
MTEVQQAGRGRRESSAIEVGIGIAWHGWII